MFVNQYKGFMHVLMPSNNKGVIRNQAVHFIMHILSTQSYESVMDHVE